MFDPPNDAKATARCAGRRSSTFDHEKLSVYQVELRFIKWVSPLLEEAKATASAKTREVCDQLDRASLSALLNTAEGNGKRRGQARAKFFDDARGSATECAACLDAMVAKNVFEPDRIVEGKEMLVQVVAMLCGLIDHFDGRPSFFHEEPTQFVIDERYRPEPRKRKTKRMSKKDI